MSTRVQWAPASHASALAAVGVVVAGCTSIVVGNEQRHAAAQYAVRSLTAAESAALRAATVTLFAPAVRDTLQEIADQIAAANEVPVKPRVHLINDRAPHLLAFDQGDVFVFAGYLDMIDNRDEMAFALAREIASMSLDQRLQDMIAHYRRLNSLELQSFVVQLVASSLINAAIHGPAVKALQKLYPPPKSIWDANSFTYSSTFKDLYYITFGTPTSFVVGLTNQSLVGAITRAHVTMAEEWDRSAREKKDGLGRVYVLKAGYDPGAADAVITKLAQIRAKSTGDATKPDK